MLFRSTLGFKIREAEIQKIPLMLVVGEKEQEGGTVSPRLRGSKQKIESLALDDVVARLRDVNVSRKRQIEFAAA